MVFLALSVIVRNDILASWAIWLNLLSSFLFVGKLLFKLKLNSDFHRKNLFTPHSFEELFF